MLHADPDRRTVVAGAGLLGLLAVPAAALAAGDDSELLRLGHLFDAAWTEQAALDAAGEAIDEVYDRASGVVDQIEQIPATTLAGLIVKARACSWCHGGEPFDPDFFDDDHQTTDVRLAASVFRDLIAIGGKPVPTV